MIARQRSAARFRAAEHELEHGLAAEGVEDDLEPSALVDEETFEQICGRVLTAAGDRRAEVRDPRLEVIHEAGGRQLGLAVCDQT